MQDQKLRNQTAKWLGAGGDSETTEHLVVSSPPSLPVILATLPFSASG